MTDLAEATPPVVPPAPAPSAWPSPNVDAAAVLPPPPMPGPAAPPAAPAAIAEMTATSASTEPATGLDGVECEVSKSGEAPTTTESTPSITTGPAAILAPDNAIAPLDHAAISLPSTPAAPSAQPASPSPSTHALFMPDELTPTARNKKSAGRRFTKFILVVAILGGLGYAGATYGPGLYDEYFGEEEIVEEAAPMAFPRARISAPEVRTATFVLEGLATGSRADYTVTVDFETNVSRVVIDRTDAPDLEVLTFSDDALVRRLDSASWYKIERGTFPLDDQLRRSDWIRMIDELVPPDRRTGVVIDESTVATVAGVTTRHLVITLDPALLGIGENSAAPLDPIADIALAAENAGQTAADPVATPAPEPTVPAPATTLAPPAVEATEAPAAIETIPVAGAPAGPNAVQIELWIDGHGVVRRSSGANVFGADSITILDTSPDAWVPDYPDTAQVQPMTAAALIDLGL